MAPEQFHRACSLVFKTKDLFLKSVLFKEHLNGCVGLVPFSLLFEKEEMNGTEQEFRK